MNSDPKPKLITRTELTEEEKEYLKRFNYYWKRGDLNALQFLVCDWAKLDAQQLKLYTKLINEKRNAERRDLSSRGGKAFARHGLDAADKWISFADWRSRAYSEAAPSANTRRVKRYSADDYINQRRPSLDAEIDYETHEIPSWAWRNPEEWAQRRHDREKRQKRDKRTKTTLRTYRKPNPPKQSD